MDIANLKLQGLETLVFCHHQAEVPRLSPPTQNNIPLESFSKRPRLWGLAEDLGSKRDLDEVVILCLPARLAKGQCGWGLAGVLAVHPCTLWS